MKTSSLILFALLIVATARAQSPPDASPTMPRKDLLTAMISPEKAVSRVEIKEVTLGPRQKAPLHSHPCPVVGVILEGTIAYQVEGETVRYLRQGDAFCEPANARVARFDNEDESKARFAVFYLLGGDDQELIRLLTK